VQYVDEILNIKTAKPTPLLEISGIIPGNCKKDIYLF